LLLRTCTRSCPTLPHAGGEYDETFKKICPNAFDRHGNVRPEAAETAKEYLRDVKGWSDEQIADEYNYGELRHPAESAKLFAASRKWDREQRELKQLNRKYNSGSMSVREAARRQTLKNT
jgi:hypothetical protein